MSAGRSLTPDELALGPRREGLLAQGAHGPITIWVELMSQHSLETYYEIKAEYPRQVGAYVRYHGHKNDLIAASCVSAELLASCRYGHFNPIDKRTWVTLESKAGPGTRGLLEVCYLTVDRPFGQALPGVRELFPEGLPRTGPTDRDGLTEWLARRPRLRLVVDNTRGRP